ncbi:hypothetical protein TIFTF001_012839 [Ficus carica]|uniref:Homeobox domain-containing protein n=1 Tax=Ficus carica TaxID=3494 RepID=A0AA88ANX2_FICCA|nr:hypothetical protein TIFTF001_012839 [Ficus carica]
MGARVKWEYGQVGDANVFYWFQNRKSRSKHKLRHLQNSKQQHFHNTHQNPPNSNITPTTTATTPPPPPIAPSSSSSSSEKSSPKVPNGSPVFSIGFTEALNSPTASVNQNNTFFQTNSSSTTAGHHHHHHHHHQDQFLAEPFFFPVHQSSTSTTTTASSGFGSQGFCFPELMPSAAHHDHHVMPDHFQQHNIGPCTSLLLSEIMNHHGASKKGQIHHDHVQHLEAGKLQLNYTLSAAAAAGAAATSSPATTPFTTAATTTDVSSMSQGNQIQGVGEQGSSCVGPNGAGAKTTVFINDVAFELPVGPFNVREAFGEEAVLIHSYGQPVLTNEWGVTLHSLQHGAFYYLVSSCP